MSFDTLAPIYRGMEWFLAGDLLHRCRKAFLQEVTEVRTALLFGEGPGRYLVELLRVNSRVRVTCVDASRGMIQAAKRHLQACDLSDERVEFVSANWSDWSKADGRFDLIATHFFLDCFVPDELGALIPRLARSGHASSLWVLSEFAEPARGWQRVRGRIILKIAYAFFRLVTGLTARGLTPPQPYLQAAGLNLRERRIYHHGLLYAELWRL